MRVYVGQTRGRALIERLRSFGWGEMVSRGELPPRRHPFAFDNGAFIDWQRGVVFNEAAYIRDLDKLAVLSIRPEFAVVPDLIAQGVRSLEFSLSWLPRLRGIAPLYVAVQDGMTEADVAPAIHYFDGVFVGGTLPWKLRTGAAWAAFAHAHGRPCHAGRIGTRNRVRWAIRAGMDSVDSCLPLWSEANLQRFLDGLAPCAQMELDL